MVWLLLLVFGFVVFGLVSKASGSKPGGEGESPAQQTAANKQAHREALLQRARAIKAAQAVAASKAQAAVSERPFDLTASEARVKAGVQAALPATTWQERVAVIEAARGDQPPQLLGQVRQITQPMGYALNDVQRAEAAPGLAFDWVAQELTWPSAAARQALQAAWLKDANSGSRVLTRALREAWAEGVYWPSGQAQVQKNKELIELLASRLRHVEHRIFRDAQVHRALAPHSPERDKIYTHAVLNRRHKSYDGDPCEVGHNKIISIEDALTLLEQPAHPHPACRCTIDPFPVSSQDRARLVNN